MKNTNMRSITIAYFTSLVLALSGTVATCANALNQNDYGEDRAMNYADQMPLQARDRMPLLLTNETIIGYLLMP